VPSKDKNYFTIGRAEHNDILVYHTTISRK